MVRLLQLGLIEPHDLARKYAEELHANEILLLAYYIAAVNIETTYYDVMTSVAEPAAGSARSRRARVRRVPRPGPHRHLPVLGGRRHPRPRRLPREQRAARAAQEAADHGHRRQPALLVGPGLRQRRQRQREVPVARCGDPPHLRRPIDGDEQELALRLLHPRHQVGDAAHPGPRRHRLRHQRRLARLQHRRRDAQDAGRGVLVDLRAQPARQRADGWGAVARRRAARSSVAGSRARRSRSPSWCATRRSAGPARSTTRTSATTSPRSRSSPRLRQAETCRGT